MRPPYLDDGDVRLYLGDCIEVLAEMDAESVDAVVCDPPYGLEFMGKEWDAPWKGSAAAHAHARVVRADEVTPTGQAHSTSAGPYLAAGVNKYEAGQPFAAWCETWAREALRVIKPGGHLLAFGGTRTFHRLTCGIEDAGFEIRDCLSWLYGSGFPKSLDVSKAIDKRRDDREDVRVVCRWLRARMEDAGTSAAAVAKHFGFHPRMVEHWAARDTDSQPSLPTLSQWDSLRELLGFGDEMDGEVYRLNIRKGEPGEAWQSRPITGKHETPAAAAQWQANYGIRANLDPKERRDVPATDAARKWQGWGTALKPAWEPCVVARKPLAGTVAENVQQHGTGALNIDGCRIGTDVITAHGGGKNGEGRKYGGGTGIPAIAAGSNPHVGRWPANVALDEAAAAMLDAQSGNLHSQDPATRASASPTKGVTGFSTGRAIAYPDTGGASRFYYTAKASRADRNTSGANNTHPTVKPTDLMRWLVRLVTPPGGVVLDPFAGSGSTLVAARAEGVRAIGIEQSEEYAGIIRDRLAQLSLFAEAS